MYFTCEYTMQWFKSYLSDRSQKCIISEKHQYLFLFHWEFHKDRFWAHYFFSIYINDLPLSIQNSETDMYSDDSTIWSSSNTCESIRQSLQESLDNANCWFSPNGMKPNAKKKNKANVTWNFSNASLCRQDMQEFVLERRSAKGGNRRKAPWN